MLTSVTYDHSDGLVRLVTTAEVIWLDERNKRKPVLAFKHDREFDRTLQSCAVNVGDGA